MSRPRVERSRARLAAVQALYQMELSGDGADEIVEQFMATRLGQLKDGDEGEALGDADDAHFARLVPGVVKKQVAIDKAIHGALAENWSLDRIDATARAILRTAVFELIDCDDVPAKVVIDEYLEVAKAFFGDGEVRFVNGVLNNLARARRPAEFGAGA
jgi:transcription antitermination protein NusB